MSGIRSIEDVRARCRVDEDSGCWVWAMAYSKSGSSCSRVPVAACAALGKKSASVYRTVWQLATGRAPIARYVVWPRCRIEGCVNLEHLRHTGRKELERASPKASWVEQSIRATRGARTRSKLTMADIAAMRASGLSPREVAQRWPMSYSQSWRILTGRAWGPLRGSTVFSGASG